MDIKVREMLEVCSSSSCDSREHENASPKKSVQLNIKNKIDFSHLINKLQTKE